MDKLYSKPILVIKAVFNVLLSPLYMILSSLLTLEDGFLYVLFSCVPIGCLFTIPFWFSLNHIRAYRVNRIGKYIRYDAVSCLFPATLGVVFSEIFTVISNGQTAVDGMASIVFGSVFVIVACVFWLLYCLFSHKN